MADSPSYEDSMVVVERAIDRYKNAMLVEVPDDPCLAMGGILHRVLKVRFPRFAELVTPEELASIDREASGHSDYHRKMALRLHRLGRDHLEC